MIKQPKKEISRREALWKMTLGGAVLAGGAGVATMILTSVGCRQTKQEDLEKKLTEFSVNDAYFGPDGKILYNDISFIPPNTWWEDVQSTWEAQERPDPRLFVYQILPFDKIPVREDNKRRFLGRYKMSDPLVENFKPLNQHGMYATRHGIAVLAYRFPQKYLNALKEKGIEQPYFSFVFVFTPDGKLVSSENMEERGIDNLNLGIAYGDEKGFYTFPLNDVGPHKLTHFFIPIDGSKPIERAGEPPGWNRREKEKSEVGNILKQKYSGAPTVYDIRKTEEGIEVLYNRGNKEEGLYYRLIPKEKLSGGK